MRHSKILKSFGTDDCNLAIESKTGRCLYRYTATDDITFEFDLLSHVGQPWIPVFERLLSDNNLQIELHEVDERPWLYERLTEQCYTALCKKVKREVLS